VSIFHATESFPSLILNGLSTYIKNSPYVSTKSTTVLYIDIIGFSRFEQNYGSRACQDVLSILEQGLLGTLALGTLPWTNVQALHIWDDGFAVIFPTSVKNEEHVSSIHRFVSEVEQRLNVQTSIMGYHPLRLRCGLSPTGGDDFDPVERLYHQITEAGRIARRHTSLPSLHLVTEMQEIIGTKNIRIHYQPIKHLQSGLTVGWECLARGPQGSELENPVALFDCAERIGCLFELEQICRTQSIRNAKVEPAEKLFINISPSIFSDPSFREGETRTVLEEYGWRPEQVVFEITEHHAVKEYASFLQIINHYRKQGYKIAIDDVGAGHSGLVTLMQVKPDFVKIDMELIRGIERDRTRQDIVQAICEISRGFEGMTIAEGIETQDELNCIRSYGVDYGQGYLFGRPHPLVDSSYEWVTRIS
jgi:EAL domain-containing protein (putative c-di-GMP-specific phosphodiesterase class I)